MKVGNWKISLKDYDHLVEKEPTMKAYLGRAYSNLQLGNGEAAANDATVAITLNPRVPHAFDVRARAYAKCGKKDEALADVAVAQMLKEKSK